MHTKPRRGAVAAAAAIGIALASSRTMLGADTVTTGKVERSGGGATWGVEDVRSAFHLGKQLKEPRIPVLVSAHAEGGHHIAAQWLTGNAATGAEHALEVKPFVAATPMDAAGRPSVWGATPTMDKELELTLGTMLFSSRRLEAGATPTMDKELTFEAFEGKALKGVIAQFNKMPWAGGMQNHLKGTGEVKYVALPQIDETVAKAWESTRFALTQIPGLVHLASGGIGNEPFVLEEVTITKGDEGKLFVGEVEADSTRTEELLTAAGWERTMIACVIDLDDPPCGGARPAFSGQVASMERPASFVDWYDKRFPRKEETLLEKIFAPRIP